MTEQESFDLHMVKVQLSQARTFRLTAIKNKLGWSFINSWHAYTLAYAAKCRNRYLFCLRRDREPVGQLEMF